METKICTKCKEEVSVERFRIKHGRKHNRSICKDCEAKQQREWRAKNVSRDKANKKAYYDRHPGIRYRERVRVKYKQLGLCPDAVCQFLDNHDGCCDICRKKSDKLHLDHNHVTNAIRGRLCNSCNTSLGKFKDSEALLLRAIEYLKQKPVVDS